MRIERTLPTEANLRELLNKQLPETIEGIREELTMLDGLGTSLAELKTVVSDLDLRKKLIDRKGILLRGEIIVGAGLRIDIATGENTGAILQSAQECSDAVKVISDLLRRADALGLGIEIRARLKKELE